MAKASLVSSYFPPHKWAIIPVKQLELQGNEADKIVLIVKKSPIGLSGSEAEVSISFTADESLYLDFTENERIFTHVPISHLLQAWKEYQDKNFSTVKRYEADSWDAFTEQLEKEGHTNISPVFHLSSQKK